MVRVRYVGLKDEKIDNVAKTGTVWLGHGDVREVPDNAWPLLARHPDVWQLETDPWVDQARTLIGPPLDFTPDAGVVVAIDVIEPAVEAPPEPAAPPAPVVQAPKEPVRKYLIAVQNEDGTQEPLALDGMPDNQLREYARLAGLKGAALNQKGDKLRAAIVEAVNAAATAEA